MNTDFSQPNTTSQILEYNRRLVAYTLMQAHADGRPLPQLFSNTEFLANVTARFALYEGGDEKRINQDLADELAAHRAQTGGGIDAATWGR